MNALVIYESLFGNTATIGEHLAMSLRTRGFDAHALPLPEVSAADIEDVDLVVVGGPTHAHGLTSSATRGVAVKDEKNTFGNPTVEPGLRGWLRDLPERRGRLAASFETRFDKPLLITGSAAKGIARRLEARGFRCVLPPESFFVTNDNRLEDGELEHATRWAARLAEAAHASVLDAERRRAV